jgi:hypothetical protein
MSAKQQRGQAAIEYLLAGTALVLALFVFEYEGRSGAQHLADTVRAFFRALTYFISLP